MSQPAALSIELDGLTLTNQDKRYLIRATGMTLHSTPPIYALLPGEVELLHDPDHHNYHGFFSCEQEMLDELSDNILASWAEHEGGLIKRIDAAIGAGIEIQSRPGRGERFVIRRVDKDQDDTLEADDLLTAIGFGESMARHVAIELEFKTETHNHSLHPTA